MILGKLRSVQWDFEIYNNTSGRWVPGFTRLVSRVRGFTGPMKPVWDMRCVISETSVHGLYGTHEDRYIYILIWFTEPILFMGTRSLRNPLRQDKFSEKWWFVETRWFWNVNWEWKRRFEILKYVISVWVMNMWFWCELWKLRFWRWIKWLLKRYTLELRDRTLGLSDCSCWVFG